MSARDRRRPSPLATDPLYAAFARLVRVQTRMWNELDARLRSSRSIPLADLTVLEVVAAVDGCRVQDIVDLLHITVGGASKVVDRLAAAGHVTRSANPHDRRSSVLTVTAQGHELLQHAKPEIDQVLAPYLTGALSNRGLAELDRLLTAMADAS